MSSDDISTMVEDTIMTILTETSKYINKEYEICSTPKELWENVTRAKLPKRSSGKAGKLPGAAVGKEFKTPAKKTKTHPTKTCKYIRGQTKDKDGTRCKNKVLVHPGSSKKDITYNYCKQCLRIKKVQSILKDDGIEIPDCVELKVDVSAASDKSSNKKEKHTSVNSKIVKYKGFKLEKIPNKENMYVIRSNSYLVVKVKDDYVVKGIVDKKKVRTMKDEEIAAAKEEGFKVYDHKNKSKKSKPENSDSEDESPKKKKKSVKKEEESSSEEEEEEEEESPKKKKKRVKKEESSSEEEEGEEEEEKESPKKKKKPSKKEESSLEEEGEEEKESPKKKKKTSRNKKEKKETSDESSSDDENDSSDKKKKKKKSTKKEDSSSSEEDEKDIIPKKSKTKKEKVSSSEDEQDVSSDEEPVNLKRKKEDTESSDSE